MQDNTSGTVWFMLNKQTNKQTAYPLQNPLSTPVMYMKVNAFKKKQGLGRTQGWLRALTGAVPFRGRQGIKEGHGELAGDSRQNVKLCACVI